MPIRVPRWRVAGNLIVVSRARGSLGIETEWMRCDQAWALECDFDRLKLQVAELNTAANASYEGFGFSTQYRRMAWPAETDQDCETLGQRQD